MTNYYPEKPIVQYMRTRIEMASVISMLKTADALTEVKRSAYIIFRIESSNGNSGINNNYCGFQADSGRWDPEFDTLISGVVKKTEAGTAKIRLFLAFNDAAGCLSMLCSKIAVRGLYIGGHTHLIWQQDIVDVSVLARAYYKEWVQGNETVEPSGPDMAGFVSMYQQAAKLFI